MEKSASSTKRIHTFILLGAGRRVAGAPLEKNYPQMGTRPMGRPFSVYICPSL